MTKNNFGPLIAYLVPGATSLVGFSLFSPTLRSWFATDPLAAPTIGGVLYLTVSSIAAGMTVSAIRWAVVDHIHARTGLSAPDLNFSGLARKVTAYGLLIEIHYQHYQFYANMFVATAIVYACHRVTLGGIWPLGWLDGAFVMLEVLFFATSRDTLKKYYSRGEQLLAFEPQPRESPRDQRSPGRFTGDVEATFPGNLRTAAVSDPARDKVSAIE